MIRFQDPRSKELLQNRISYSGFFITFLVILVISTSIITRFFAALGPHSASRMPQPSDTFLTVNDQPGG